MLVIVSVIGAIAGIPPPAREQFRIGASAVLHMAEAAMVTGPPEGNTAVVASVESEGGEDHDIGRPPPARFSAPSIFGAPEKHIRTVCRLQFCMDQWSHGEWALGAAILLGVPTLCVLLTVSFAAWMVLTQPSQQARMAWYCLSAALQQFDNAPTHTQLALAAKIGMSMEQATHFFKQLRRLLTAIQ